MSAHEKNARLDRLLAGEGPVVAPGVADALGARLVEVSGFDAVYMSGFAVAGSLAKPDVGLLSMKEVLDRAAQIADSVTIPLVVDVDDGYGNVVNVVRTVREFERAGVSSVQLEDQRTPKRCGVLGGKALIGCQEMVGKIKACTDTRRDRNLKVIARTDAIEVEGLDHAIERSIAYRDAGADLLMFSGPKGEEDVSKIVEAVRHPLAYINADTAPNRPAIAVPRLGPLGVKLVVFPLTILFSAARAALNVLAEIKKVGSTDHLRGEAVSWEQFHDIVGLPEVRRIEATYGG